MCAGLCPSVPSVGCHAFFNLGLRTGRPARAGGDAGGEECVVGGAGQTAAGRNPGPVLAGAPGRQQQRPIPFAGRSGAPATATQPAPWDGPAAGGSAWLSGPYPPSGGSLPSRHSWPYSPRVTCASLQFRPPELRHRHCLHACARTRMVHRCSMHDKPPTHGCLRFGNRMRFHPRTGTRPCIEGLEPMSVQSDLACVLWCGTNKTKLQFLQKGYGSFGAIVRPWTRGRKFVTPCKGHRANAKSQDGGESGLSGSGSGC